MGQAKRKKELKKLGTAERFQQDATKIVQQSQFLQENGGAGWATVPVDGGKNYIGLLFDAEHWAIIQGELYYHPSGTFSGDGMVFSSVEPIKPRPPMSNRAFQTPSVEHRPQHPMMFNNYGMLQVVEPPKKRG